MDLAIFGLFKGSEKFFGAKTTTRSSNCLPEPNPISFQVWVGPPDYHPEMQPPIKPELISREVAGSIANQQAGHFLPARQGT
ncbi:hypothetical protein PCANC_11104 [Puccinia coronata f. sp. avenae]|uniref:Uncharacterized protein n=1 Tax=Puccinia coronata f. sp. avenae TaxID=200324 RepID=A0A2N5UW44_9BASI|nr:hypothetical protein PCANC_11104 [Puccinia coronata f. sp. avenae]